DITIEVRLTGSVPMTSRIFSLGTVLPGLALEVEHFGDLNVTEGFDYANLKFDLQGGNFFLDTAAANEFTASVTATPKHSTMTGIIGFLDMTATPNPAGPTRLNAVVGF